MSFQTTQPRPGYTNPNLCPDVLIDRTHFNLKSHFLCGSRKGNINPPEAASTWIGMSYPVFLLNSSRALSRASTSSFNPVQVTPSIGTMQIVFSSHIFKASTGSRVVFSRVRGTSRISICQSCANFSQTT